ncbi:MAG: translocation/assembly module TamB [bacterium]|nr:translocation/assembly module TamB [bacterium]
MLRALTRLLLWPLALVAALLASAFFLIQQEPVQQYVVKHALTILNRKIAGSLEISHAALLLDGRVSASDVVIRDGLGNKIVSADRVRGWIAPWDIARGKIHLLSATVEGLRGELNFDSTGNSLAAAFAAQSAKPDTATKPLWIRLDRVALDIDSLTVRVDTSFTHVLRDCGIHADLLVTDSVITYETAVTAAAQFTLQSEGVIRPYSDTLFAGDVTLECGSPYIAAAWATAMPDLGAIRLFAQGDVRKSDLAAVFRLDVEHVGKINGDLEILDYAGQARASLGAQFTELSLAHWIGDSIAHSFSGRAALTKTKSPSWMHDWLARIELDSSHYGDIQAATDLEAELYESSAFLAGAIRTSAGTFNVRVNSDGLEPDSIALFGTASLEQANLHAFVPAMPDSLSPLSGDVDFYFERQPAREPLVDVRMTLGTVALGRYALDSLAFHANVRGTAFTLDSTRIRLGSASALLFAKGDYADSIRATFTADIPRVHDFRDLMGSFAPALDSLRGDLEIDASATLTFQGDSLHDVTAQGIVSSSELGYGDYRLFNSDLAVDELNLETETLHAKLSADSAHAFDETIQPLTLTLDGGWYDPLFSCTFSARHDTVRAAAAGSFSYAESPMQLIIESLALNVFGTTWSNDYPIEFALDSTHYEVAALVLRSDFGVLRATGYVENPGKQDLVLEFSGLQTGKLVPLLRTDIPDGNLNLRVQLSGPDSAMAGRIELALDSLAYKNDLLADRITISADFTDRHTMDAAALYLWYGDTAIVASASVPALLSMQDGLTVPEGDDLSGTLLVDSLPLGRFSPWLAAGTVVDGYLTSDLSLSGSARKPNWSGSINLHDGFYRDTRYGIAYKWIVLDAALVRDSLRINTFRATSRGTLTGSGFARLGVPWPEELSLDLKFDQFEAVSSRIQKARLDGMLTVTGPFDSLHAAGNLTITEGLYRITQSATKTIEPINMDSVLAELRGDSLEQGFNPDAFYLSMGHDVTVSIPGNFWIRGSGLNTELSGNLKLEKDAYQDPTANGKIAIRKGTVKFYGQELSIQDNSTLSFDGPVGEPDLDITAIYTGIERARGPFDVTVHLTGTPDNSAAAFSGKFANGAVMSEDEAVQRLLPFIGNTGGTAEQAVAEAASGQVSDIVSKASGLDVFEFRPGEEGLNDLSTGQLEIGTYVTDRLFIRVYQPVDDIRAGQKVSVDYRLLDWMKFTAEQTSAKKEDTGTSFTIYMQFEWR